MDAQHPWWRDDDCSREKKSINTSIKNLHPSNLPICPKYIVPVPDRHVYQIIVVMAVERKKERVRAHVRSIVPLHDRERRQA